jgi:cytoskeletal protein CcmA (bactofilin family)
MLKRNKKIENDKLPAAATGSADIKNTSSLSTPASRDAKTIIGEHIFIEGSIIGEETLEIAGSMKGSIVLKKHDFTIGPKGRVEGQIHARNVRIRGELKGNIKASEKVGVTQEADFYGEIKAKSISVEDGAYFKGVIELDREPHRKSADTQTLKKPSAPEPREKKVSASADVKEEK